MASDIARTGVSHASGSIANQSNDRSTPHARGNALSAAVHEINNPLDAVLELLFMIERDAGLSEQSRRHLRMAEAELSRISQIAQSAMKQLHRQEAAIQTDVAELLASVLELHSSKLKSTGISVIQRYCENAKLAVFPELMRQLFNNLLLNAIDAMPKGGKLRAKVVAAHEWLGCERTGLRITVADNGTGIAPEVLKRVREPFFTTKGADGNGMGLPVAQEIMTQHSGVLKIRSCIIPGKTGTVITMFIPSGIARA